MSHLDEIRNKIHLDVFTVRNTEDTRYPGTYTGYTWAVRWDPVTRLLYSLEGAQCVIRSLHDAGKVLGSWEVDPGHDLLVDTRDGKTTVHIGEMQTSRGKIPCFCGCAPFSTNL